MKGGTRAAHATSVKNSDPVAVDVISSSLSIPPVLAHILYNRGCYTPRQASAFLYPKIEDMHDPSLLPHLTEAVELCAGHVNSRRRIGILGDYDVDGVLSSIILDRCLCLAGCETAIKIPNRFREGYGLSRQGIDELAEKGAGMIICLDNGTNAADEINYANSLGIKVIVIDHHEPRRQLPDALIINPKLESSGYPFAELCSSSLAFKFASMLSLELIHDTALRKNFLFDSLALAAVGTIADVVPLINENRAIVAWGMKALANCRIKGVRTAIEELRVSTDSTYDLSFKLIPFFNAFGRMHEASTLVRLLKSDRDDEVNDLIRLGIDLNNLRKVEETRILSAALKKVDESAGVILVYGDGWHEGVLGIVATKLTEKYNKPAIVLTRKGDTYKGSGRSVKGVDITAIFEGCSDLLTRSGGHKMAGGLELPALNLADFRARLAQMTFKQTDQQQDIDSEISIRDVTTNLAKMLKLLEPYGYGNRESVFLIRRCRIINPTTIGRNENHLSFLAVQGEAQIRAVLFDGSVSKHFTNKECDIICNIRLDNYLGDEKAELIVKEII